MTGILTISVSGWTASNDPRLMDEASANNPIKAANTTAQEQDLLSKFKSALKESKEKNAELAKEVEGFQTVLGVFDDLGSLSLIEYYENLTSILDSIQKTATDTPNKISQEQATGLQQYVTSLNTILPQLFNLPTFQRKLEEGVKQTEKNLAAISDELKTKQLSIKNLEEKYTELDEQVKRKQIQIEELKEEAKKLKKAKTQEEKARAETEKKEDSFTKKLKDRIRELEDSLHQTQSEKEAIQDQDQKQKRILQKFEEEKTELQNKLDLLEAGNKGFKETLEKRQKETSDLVGQARKIKEELQKKEQELEKLVSKYQALEETNKALQTTSQQNKDEATKMALTLNQSAEK